MLTAPPDYIAKINMFNSTYALYTHRSDNLMKQQLFVPFQTKTNNMQQYAIIIFNLFFICSYLGNGLIAGRLATLGALGADGND